MASPALYVVMYHYVRDLPHTPFPRIKGMLTSAFRQQLTALQSLYEMATLESALDFLRGRYTPSRPLCLLTFDDGLKEHYTDVTPILVDTGVQDFSSSSPRACKRPCCTETYESLPDGGT